MSSEYAQRLQAEEEARREAERKREVHEHQLIWFWVRRVGLTIGGVIALGMWGCPAYQVYSARLSGEAALAEAEGNRRIQIADAKAKAEAATLQAEATVKQAVAKASADTIHAHGVAQSNLIIGRSLHDNPDYLKYVYLQALDKAQTMYVPTEGGFPIFLKDLSRGK